MKTACLYAMLVFLACGLGLVFEDFGQQGRETELNPGITIILGEKRVTLPTEVIEKAKKARVAKPSSRGDLVASLVQFYQLDKERKPNQSLMFGAEQIKYWKDQGLDRETLTLEFAARQIILDAAAKQNVNIRDQDMLSAAAQDVILLLRRTGPIPTPTSQAASSPQKEQSVDVACKICQCQGGDISQDLIKKAWDAFNANKGGMDPTNFQKALACTRVTISNFDGKADEQQATRLQSGQCKKPPKKDEKEKDAYFEQYWALSDIAAGWFIRGQVFEQEKRCTEAKEAYNIIVAKYNCAYIWDPRGWFWNPAEGAEQRLKHLEKGCTGQIH